MREAAVLATAILAGAALVAGADTADKIHIRDPFVVVDREKGCYCLLSSCFAPPGERGNDFFAFLGTGAKIYESKDLVNWSEARQVLTIPDWVGCRALWAPELHQFRGKWYILGTVNGADNRRGTWTFVSENLRGLYRPTGRRPITPPEWLALDGTLWVEDDKPYMVFCHEWVQIGDGEMCYVQMNDDLSAPVGEPRTLFKATDYTASPSKARCLDHVTDGPFLYRSPKSGRLFMTWSNVDAKRQYVVVLSESASGRLSGPWGRHKVIFGKDGGHGMLFRKLDGSLAFALHQPNAVRRERPKFFPVEDDGETLRIVQGNEGSELIDTVKLIQ